MSQYTGTMNSLGFNFLLARQLMTFGTGYTGI